MNGTLTLSFAQVLQLYAPLAGLLVVVFWLGVLSQRVKNLEAVLSKMEEGDAQGGVVDRLARLEVHSETAAKALEKISTELNGVQRQLGNLFVKNP